MLRVGKRTADGIAVLELEGSIDGGDSCREIHQVFKSGLDEGIRKFVLDVGKVEWINSLGVGFLVAAAVSASRQDAIVRLTGLSTRVDTILRACGLVPHIWRDFADEDAALASFG